MQTVTLKLSDNAIEAVRRQAQNAGKDFTQHLQEQLETQYGTSEPLPAHLDPSRYITAEQLRQHAREKHGFPPEWGTDPRPTTEQDWENFDLLFAPDPESVK